MGRRAGFGLVTVVLLAGAVAPAAPARVPAEASAQKRLAKFTLMRVGATPASVAAGSRFRVRGRVANRRGRRAQTARVTFSLRRARSTPARRGLRLRGANVKRIRGGRSRRFSVRVRVPASARPAATSSSPACVAAAARRRRAARLAG